MLTRGKIFGGPIDDDWDDETKHFLKCPQCGGMIDCRDLGVVLAHEGPLPHPAEDRLQ
jgi:hypothetical protein